MVLCNIPGVNHLQWRQGWAGDQNAHITTAGVLCGGRAVDLGDFHFLMSKHMNMLQKRQITESTLIVAKVEQGLKTTNEILPLPSSSWDTGR